MHTVKKDNSKFSYLFITLINIYRQLCVINIIDAAITLAHMLTTQDKQNIFLKAILTLHIYLILLCINEKKINPVELKNEKITLRVNIKEHLPSHFAVHLWYSGQTY